MVPLPHAPLYQVLHTAFASFDFFYWLLVVSTDSVATIPHTAGARQTWTLEPSAQC
jgi:hypothetical protein